MESVLGRLDGVITADADFRTGRAVVTFDPDRITPERIVEAFNEQSFYRARLAPDQGDAQVGVVVLKIPAMMNQRAIQRVVRALEPFQEAILSGSIARGELTIEYDPTRVKATQLVEAINQGTPYQATIGSITGPEAQAIKGSGVTDAIYTVIEVGKYPLWALVGLAILLLVRKGITGVQARITGR